MLPDELQHQQSGEGVNVYRTLFAGMAEGVVLQDVRGVVFACNPSAERILGFGKGEMIGGDSIDRAQRAIHRDGQPFLRELHPAMAALRTGEACLGVTMGLFKPNQEIVWIQIDAQPLFSAGGTTPYAVISTFTDITAQMRSEQARQQADDRFRKAFLAGPEGITISRLEDGRYIEVNDAFVEWSGYQRSELIGKTSRELNIWVDPAERVELLRKLNSQRLVRDQAMTFRTKSGRLADVVVSADVIEFGDQTCLLAITRDVTKQKLLEAQLQQAQKMEAVGNLAGGIAHDFNNLLGVILGYGEMMLEKLGPDDALRKPVEGIKKAGDHAAALTSQLLAFSRKQIVEPQIIDLNTAVEEVRWLLERLIGDDVRLVTNLHPALGKVVADPHQIEQVLMNLCINARDAMPEGGSLMIETRNIQLDAEFTEQVPGASPGAHVEMTVTDTGVGIEEGVKSHLFEPFFTTKPPDKGTGLGLATVYGIVKQAGGWIQVSSEPGEGARFAIFLPQVTSAPEAGEPRQETEPVLTGTETVLLVEDARSMSEISRAFLEGAGYNVLECASSAEALSVAENYQGSIDLLSTDLILSGMNGRELAERVTLRRPNLKVLYTSGYADRGMLRGDARGPRRDFVAKPYTRRTFLQKVRELLDRDEGNP